MSGVERSPALARRLAALDQAVALFTDRQARRTVSLYEKYKGRVQFVIIDLDHRASAPQQELQKKYYRGYIPHVVVLDSSGAALYNQSGEVEEGTITGLLDKALR